MGHLSISAAGRWKGDKDEEEFQFKRNADDCNIDDDDWQPGGHPHRVYMRRMPMNAARGRGEWGSSALRLSETMLMRISTVLMTMVVMMMMMW